jgi:hypothetical protein
MELIPPLSFLCRLGWKTVNYLFKSQICLKEEQSNRDRILKLPVYQRRRKSAFGQPRTIWIFDEIKWSEDMQDIESGNSRAYV